MFETFDWCKEAQREGSAGHCSDLVDPVNLVGRIEVAASNPHVHLLQNQGIGKVPYLINEVLVGFEAVVDVEDQDLQARQ